MTKLIAFDLDRTLIRDETLDEIARKFGKEKEVAEITELGMCGKISWEAGVRKRLAILRQANQNDFTNFAKCTELTKGAKRAIQELKKQGFATAIITGGFREVADIVAERLGIDFVVANKLIFENRLLAGCHLFVNGNKGEWLKTIAKSIGAELTVAVGDGANDLPMLRAADIAVGFNAKDKIKQHIDFEVYDLARLPKILAKLKIAEREVKLC